MHVITNHAYARRSSFRAQLRRTLTAAARRVWAALKMAWFAFFPAPPEGPHTNAKMAALRQGARLTENLDAVARKRSA